MDTYIQFVSELAAVSTFLKDGKTKNEIVKLTGLSEDQVANYIDLCEKGYGAFSNI